MGENGDMDRKSECRIVRADRLEAIFPLLEGYGEVYLVCDRNVWDKVGRLVAENLAGLPPTPCASTAAKGKLLGVSLIDATEAGKTMSAVEKIAGEMLESGADRSVLVLGIGGGITTDIAGFAASIYKRGVRFAFVPTTLLAQADAAIGGKNGVNFSSYKNMLGVIRQPEFTYICPEPLCTLSQESVLCGIAEMLKTFIIAAPEAYAEAVSVLKAWAGDPVGKPGEPGDSPECRTGSADSGTGCAVFGIHEAEIGKLAAKAAEIKASIVERDPDERGLRRVLNLGHTFAHAIETLSAGGWAHGMAVAAGIVAAARLAESVSGKVADTDGRDFCCQSGLAARIERDFRAVGLPTGCPFSMAEMSGVMSFDKKAEGRQINFVLPSEIGTVRVVKLGAEYLL